ncbi:hypothetical protein HPB47_008303 [Ixodes persulcatus]|uniref:Uncharacterized protein n=1 Tax=Ixodes persulcatus TaxID=34615 RepID=A0AC60P5D0_IXOPE|nr:hypothetical protein HPB47_008303 [Ixodes persulcatus]
MRGAHRVFCTSRELSFRVDCEPANAAAERATTVPPAARRRSDRAVFLARGYLPEGARTASNVDRRRGTGGYSRSVPVTFHSETASKTREEERGGPGKPVRRTRAVLLRLRRPPPPLKADDESATSEEHQNRHLRPRRGRDGPPGRRRKRDLRSTTGVRHPSLLSASGGAAEGRLPVHSLFERPVLTGDMKTGQRPVHARQPSLREVRDTTATEELYFVSPYVQAKAMLEARARKLRAFRLSLLKRASWAETQKALVSRF